MADLSGLQFESKRGKGCVLYYPDVRLFHSTTRAALAEFGRCESCGGPLSLDRVRCKKQSRHRGIWIAEETDLEQIELLIGEEKRRNKNRQRAERRMEAMSHLPGFHRRSDLRVILQSQNGRCYYCGVAIDQKSARRDHLEPLNAARSSNWPSNIVFACFPCNRDKSDMSPNAFWKIIERRLGSKWVKDQKARNAVVTDIARKLTKQRKAQLTQPARSRTTAYRSTRSKQRATES